MGITSRAFSSSEFLPDGVLARLTDIRVSDPEYARRAADRRTRRRTLSPDGRLNILAADHPARGVTKVGDSAIAMADRRSYLARVVRILMSETVDGVMATMDVLEELLILDGLLRDAGAPELLNNKLLIASLNRAGLVGSVWELDDPVSGPSPATCQEWGLDGAKFLLRIASADAASQRTMLAAAEAITQSNALRLPFFLEPLPVVKTDRGWTVVKSAEALAVIAGVASALGDSSRYLWLKLPYCEGYDRVVRATTLPILLLGGESAGDPAPFLSQMASALGAGPNVRGALVGRNVLYPGDEDPLAMAEAVGGIVHGNWAVEKALDSFAANRGRDLDFLSQTLESRSLGGIT
jgi:DhnA family fructose-bisphosphate aldolase class Ia